MVAAPGLGCAGAGAAVAAAGGHRIPPLAAGRGREPEGQRPFPGQLLSAGAAGRLPAAGGARDLAHGGHRHRRHQPGPAGGGSSHTAEHTRAVGVGPVRPHGDAALCAAPGAALDAGGAAQRAGAGVGAGLCARGRSGADGRRAGDCTHLRRHAGQGLWRDPGKWRNPCQRNAAAQRQLAPADLFLCRAAGQRSRVGLLHRIPMGMCHPLVGGAGFCRRGRVGATHGQFDEDVQRR